MVEQRRDSVEGSDVEAVGDKQQYVVAVGHQFLERQQEVGVQAVAQVRGR